MPVIFTLPEKKTRDLRKSGQRKVFYWSVSQLFVYEYGCVNKTRLNLEKKKHCGNAYIFQRFSGSIIFLGVSTFLNLDFWPSFEYRNEQFNL